MTRRSKVGGNVVKTRRRTAVPPRRRDAPAAARQSISVLEERLRLQARELEEAREQQVAAADVLKVISRSPTDVQPVFDMIAESARRLCDGQFCFFYRFDGQLLHFVAHHSLTTEVLEMNRRAYPAPPSRRSAAARAVLEGGFVQIPDISADPDYVLGGMAVVGNYRSVVAVPILRDGRAIGSIAVARAQPGLLPDPQIELLKTFADQAVIAIENVRLFDAEQQRTRELSESLEQQTATSEVLKVISTSQGELQPVFDAILENATRICEANFGNLILYDGEVFRRVALYNAPAAWAADQQMDARPTRQQAPLLYRLAETKAVVHVADVATDPGETIHKFSGARSLLLVPMLKGGELVGGIGIYRQEVRPFNEKQIELLANFAAQAVIAIENTRLLNELRQRTDDLSESLEQQTATSEVLHVISSSPGDLAPVFEAVLKNATRICEARFGTLFRYDGDKYHLAAQFGTPPDLVAFQRQRGPFRPPPGGHLDEITRTKCIRHTADVAADPNPGGAATLGGARSAIYLPMLKDNELIGALVIYRQEVRPFTDKQIELVRNFASQAVIAIENTRLLNELRESLEQQTATSEVLRVISSSPGELKPVFQTMLENAVRICGAKFGMLYLAEGEGFRTVAMHDVPRAFAEHRGRKPLFVSPPGSPMGRVVRTRQVAHVSDITTEQGYIEGDRALVDLAVLGGARTLAAVPMFKDNDLVGAIVIYRQEVLLFTEKQIELVKNFAAQAVVAIENTRLLNELRQSLEQQTATADVLRVISSSPGELTPVFNTILENATSICEAKFGNLWLREGDAFRIAATHGAPPAYRQFFDREPLVHPDPRSGLGIILETKQLLQIADITQSTYKDKMREATIRFANGRSLVGVPLLKDNEVVGGIAIYRQEVRPFTDKQIQLLQNFAAQAVIAIENARLLNELRQRTDDLSESLEQQTATSEVLSVISSSPGELDPVFQSMLANATRICEAKSGFLFRAENDDFRIVASLDERHDAEQFRHQVFKFPPSAPIGRAKLTRQTVHVPNLAEDQAYLEREPLAVWGVEQAHVRTVLVVPMLKEQELIGVFGIQREEVRPFTDRQIDLVKSFAAQAVIAIENTRLLNELRQSLEQQTATADVLRVISSTPGELEPVFNSMLENATRICDAKFGTMYFREGDDFRAVAMYGAPQAYVEARLHKLRRPGPNTGLGRVVRTKEVVQIEDITADRGQAEGDPMRAAAMELGGVRTLLSVPLLKDNEVIGAIAIYREIVRPFTDKQIELVRNFAAQAVIAIENTRLLNELRQSLQQQTATADVLKVISRSTFDLHTVLDTLVESAARLCEADKASINRAQDGGYRAVAMHGFSEEFRTFMAGRLIPGGAGSTVGRTAMAGSIIQIPDVTADPEYRMMDVAAAGNFRTLLGVPLLREGTPTGVLVLIRSEVRPFTEKQIELAQTFADQAVIAIENVRLFETEQQRTRELARSLDDLRTAQDRLVQTQKLASLGQLTAGIAHEIKNPLNFVNNFSGLSVELIDELKETLGRLSADEKTRNEIAELTDTLRGNLDKIAQHGKRADSIVKNMLLHSREGSGERRLVSVNALVEESLSLAYHGARAEKQGFTITLERSLDPEAGEADVFPQEITRVLLNLISNGFYAAIKRQEGADNDGYEPILSASTRSLGEKVEIRIRDNGTGIPPEVKEKMFNPFFTTKPAGEGTGLGLSISHDIIVKQHAGSIEVETEPGEFTEFRIILPRTAP
jgi:GAF domain-containing protein